MKAHFQQTPAFLLAACLAIGSEAASQSISGSISGTVRDEQQAALSGATVTIRNTETGSVRVVQTEARGEYRVLGLLPGTYSVTIDLAGFVGEKRADITLALNEELELRSVLRIAPVAERVDVAVPVIEVPRTALGRKFTQREIESLPVPSRDFSTLAQLTPGILINRSGLAASPTNPGIAASGQFSRNNRLIIDGLLFDRLHTGLPKRGYSIDAVREFAVLSNGFTAEFGQAAGAVVSVVTRSGTNRRDARVFYFHRDDGLDATPGSAKLAGENKASLEQRVVGGFLGGPVRRDHAFFFISVEHTETDNDWIVSSPDLRTLRPDEPSVFPNPLRSTDLFGRGDIEIGPRDRVTVRAHASGFTQKHATTELPRTTVARERTISTSRDERDVGLVHTRTFGSRAVNELRAQFAAATNDVRAPYCNACPTENRVGLRIGVSPNPQYVSERYWQIADTATVVVPDRWGDHTMKAGLDVILARNVNDALINPFGTFTFRTNEPFDPANRATWPVRFEQRIGEGVSRLTTRLYALYVQDQWRPLATLTLNLGARWDYVDSFGITKRADNVAPRLGVAFDPWRKGRTSIRGTLGRYYDSVYLQYTREEAIAHLQETRRIENPAYVPWIPGTPFVNPLLGAGASTTLRDTRTVLTKDIPYTDQASVGVQHAFGDRVALAVDAVRSRGRNLLLTRDQNYPLNVGTPGSLIRPDSNVEKVTAVESIGNSWYSALLLGIDRRHADGYGWSIGYTFSSSERDTEQAAFLPQDHRNPGADRGPSLSDVRHRLAGSFSADLPWDLRLASVLIAESAAPYSVTLGPGPQGDINFDGFDNDRPAGVARNSERGDDLWQVDLRISKTFRLDKGRLELLAEAFNIANHQNWSNFDGVKTSNTFRQPGSAEPPRQVQLGVRFDF